MALKFYLQVKMDSLYISKTYGKKVSICIRMDA